MSLLTTGIIQEFITTHQLYDPAPYVYSYSVVLSAVGTNTFVVPANCVSIGVGLIGGGSAGLGVSDVSGLGAATFPGGGGGGYAYSLLTVSGGTLTQTAYTYNIGEGGDKNTVAVFQPIPSVATYYGKSGGTSYFGNLGCNHDNAIIRAMGGGGSDSTPPNNPTNYGGGDDMGGGLPNVGQITYVGGFGATSTQTGTYKIGGGGGGAGNTGYGGGGSQNDGLGNWASGGTGANISGGDGGLGFWIENNIVNGKIGGSGTDGFNYGGGGGGCGRYNAFGTPPSIRGGSGAQGLMTLDITISVPYFT
jgi:hypothetical protein